jgi:2-polyprenyl-3-methyl-5-hydroxy-6-metoxy-1,4-benzoquinol methylase
VAAEVSAVDLDEQAIAFCRDTWGDANVTFTPGNVLALPFEAGRFDVVLCMEAIEHFSRDDGRRYLEELRRVCRPGGMIFGSSAFPETRAAADALCAQNEHHLYIYTRAEMKALLRDVFSRPLRLTKHYFAAEKRR